MLRSVGRWTCSVCWKEVKSNFSFCVFCKHWELLPVLTSKVFRIVVRYGGETRVLKEEDVSKLWRKDRRMLRWTYNVAIKDGKSSDVLRDRLGLVSIRCFTYWRVFISVNTFYILIMAASYFYISDCILHISSF